MKPDTQWQGSTCGTTSQHRQPQLSTSARRHTQMPQLPLSHMQSQTARAAVSGICHASSNLSSTRVPCPPPRIRDGGEGVINKVRKAQSEVRIHRNNAPDLKQMRQRIVNAVGWDVFRESPLLDRAGCLKGSLLPGQLKLRSCKCSN